MKDGKYESQYSFQYNGNEWCKVATCPKQKTDTIYSLEYGIITWHKKSDSCFVSPRDGLGLCQLGKYMYSFGGWVAGSAPTTNSHVFMTNGDLANWHRIDDAPWEGRHCFGLVSRHDSLWIFGGDYARGHYEKDSWLGTTDTVGHLKWQKLNSNLPWGERVLFGSCLHNGAMYVIGGQEKAEEYKKKLTDEHAFSGPVVTEIAPYTKFYKAEDYHQNYYNENSNQGYCQFVVKPKMDKFKKVFKDKLKSDR